MDESGKDDILCPPLKKCPWCGEKAEIEIHALGSTINYKGNGEKITLYTVNVKCINVGCQATAPYGKENTIGQSLQDAVYKAARKWNTRIMKED